MMPRGNGSGPAGMYQADATEQMQVSRRTFQCILNSAHTRIASALVNGHALMIEDNT